MAMRSAMTHCSTDALAPGAIPLWCKGSFCSQVSP